MLIFGPYNCHMSVTIDLNKTYVDVNRLHILLDSFGAKFFLFV